MQFPNGLFWKAQKAAKPLVEDSFLSKLEPKAWPWLVDYLTDPESPFFLSPLDHPNQRTNGFRGEETYRPQILHFRCFFNSLGRQSSFYSDSGSDLQHAKGTIRPVPENRGVRSR